MKKPLLLVFVILFSMLAAYPAIAQSPLSIGSRVPMLSHKMEDVSGRNISLGEAAQQNGLLVIFTCNTCPVVMRWEDRYPEISRLVKSNRIGMIALNANEAYRDRGDGFDEMVKRAQKMNYDFNYVLDENHQVADAFGATRTPHVFLFNGDMELVYSGAIDDNANNRSAVKQPFLLDAVQHLINGTPIAKPTTRPQGCTIKRMR